ncbi:hypothetical protein C8J57DRAFT_1729399 [Mycena rebaudengoi]|nr:hypothetical protein C8J57DRAFT_1729399 [Mycena rebaudengoi]
MTANPEYQSFLVFAGDPNYAFSNTSDSGDRSAFPYVVSIYRGLPAGQTPDSAVDDKRRFIFLGKKYSNFFMQLKDFGDRFAWKTLALDFDRVKKNEDPFPVWNSKGKLVAVPRTFFVSYVPGDTVATWSASQQNNWRDVITAVGEATAPIPYNVISRFIQPAPFPGFELVFSPTSAEEHVSKTELETYVEEAMTADTAPKYPYRVLSYTQAQSDTSLVLLSTSFYPFYHTWISSANYQQLCSTVLNTDPLARPWPADATAAASIDALLKNEGLLSDGISTDTLVSADKMKAAHGMRTTLPTQSGVMGASATEVANLLWAKSTLDPKRRPADAEWLHRSAFHYAGLGSNVNLASSQNRLNLVFGTGECNTDMIRGENAVTGLANLLIDSGGSGTLLTQNFVQGPVLRRLTTGRYVTETMPTWVQSERNKGRGELFWLSMKLGYRFTLSDKDLNLNFNCVTEYDPFSRYMPFRIEARLDQIILREVVEKHRTATSNPKKKPKTGASLSGSSLTSELAAVAINVEVPRAITTSPTTRRLVPANSRSSLHSTSSSTLPLPPPTFERWSRVASGVDALERALAALRGPISFTNFTSNIAGGSLSPLPSFPSTPPPDGFTLEGEIDLFGVSAVQAHFYSWNGPIPPDIVVSVDQPIYDKAIIDGDFKLSSILPILASTPFNDLTFTNVTITHQNCVFDVTKAIGWHVDADFVVDATYGPLYDLLRTVLNVQEPTIHLHAGLGLNQGWGIGLAMSSFTLDGTFPGILTKICDGLALTSIGIELMGIRRMKMVPPPRSVMDFGFGVFGTLNIDVPGSVVPLELSYRIVEMNGFLQLIADLDGELWKDPLGIQGLSLSNVVFTSDVKVGSPMQSFDLEVMATFQYKSTSAVFSGSYAAAGAFSLAAAVTDIDLDSINDIFESLTNSALEFPDLDVTIGSASITVASGVGLTISLQNVQVGDYVAANALLSIGSSGVLIRGDITSSNTVVLGEVELNKAYVQITLPNQPGGSSVVLGGEISFEGFTLDALVHLYQGQDNSGLQWTVIASLTAAGNILALSKLVPELKGTFLDLTLTNAVFVAASQQDPSVSSYLTTPYPIHQGVQICATLSPIQALDSLMRSPTLTSGLVLSAGWSKATGFTLDVVMPSESAGTSPMLLIIADVKIPVEPEGNTLQFQLSLGVDMLGARASAQMHGWWVNPLGLGQQCINSRPSRAPAHTSVRVRGGDRDLSGIYCVLVMMGGIKNEHQNVKIGPDVALAIEIIFAQFLTTGTPSGFGVVAGLAIGKTTGSVAMQISENPMHEILSGEVQKLDVNDLISFANTITNLDIPQPSNFLDFEEVKLYICPTTTTIGTIVYPQGFSFQAAMILFGKRAEIACAVGSSSVKIQGGVDNFTLGPLTVRGVNEPRAMLEVDLEVARQHMLIDGMVTFFDVGYPVSIMVDVLPNPAFSFYTALKFTELLTFTLEAKLVGAITFSEIDQADFDFYASLEQDILEYVREQINIQFDAARTAADEGFAAADAKLTAAQEAVDKGINDAQKRVDAAQKAVDAVRALIAGDANRVISNYMTNITRLEQNVTKTQSVYDRVMASAQTGLQTANNNRAIALRGARTSLDEAKRTAQQAIDTASTDASRNAKAKVDSLQSEIDTMQRTIDQYNALPWYDPRHIAVPGIQGALDGLKATKATADAVLKAAELVLNTPAYIAANLVLDTAQKALQAARDAAPGIISIAQSVLDNVDTTTLFAVNMASAIVEEIRNGPEYIASQAAQAAVTAFVAANKAAFDAAEIALASIANTIQWAELQAAQTALSVAKAATSSLDGLKEALAIAQTAEDLSLKIAKLAGQQATGIVDISMIELSGSLRGLVTPDGAVGKPLMAHVQYVLAGKSGTFDGELDLRKTSAFITAIFRKLWDEIDSIV